MNIVIILKCNFNNNISFKVLIIFVSRILLECLLQTICLKYHYLIFQQKNRIGINIYISEIIATFGLVFFILISKKSNTE